MTVLSADTDIDRGEDTLIEVPVTASEIIYKGALVCIDTDGYALAAADTADYKFIGIAYDKQDNSSGADAAKKVRVYRRGIFKLTFTSITQVMVGQLMYITDDQTVDDQSTNWICCGRLVKYVSATSGWVDIGDRQITATVSWRDNVEAAWGDDQDIVMDWDGTNFNIIPAADDTVVIWGTTSYTLHLRMGIDSQIQFRSTGAYIYSPNTNMIVIRATSSSAEAIYLYGNTWIGGTTELGGIATFDSAAVFNAGISSTLAVTGMITANGSITIPESKVIAFWGGASIYGAASNCIIIRASGASAEAIYLYGKTWIGGTLTVSGVPTFSAAAVFEAGVSSALAVTGVITANGSITIPEDKSIGFWGGASISAVTSNTIRIRSTSSSVEAIYLNGNVWISGTMTFNNAAIDVPSMPTADPSVAGRLWANSGVVTVSSG